MKVVIGCDVDPILPNILTRPPSEDIWRSVDPVNTLLQEMGSDLPPMTWLIRSDASVQFATGQWASGYLSRESTWQRLSGLGHELGWHMHLLSWDEKCGAFRFDAQPAWISEAHHALAQYFPIHATRTGWDYGSDFLLGSLDRLGVLIDFSALPAGISWFRAGPDTVVSDWRQTAGGAYRPDSANYQKSGDRPLRLVELPIAQFRNGPLGIAKRVVWRALNGCFSLGGLRNRTKMLTEAWDGLPRQDGGAMAFFFHPEDLTGEGMKNLMRNIRTLAGLTGAEFVTASSYARSFQT